MADRRQIRSPRNGLASLIIPGLLILAFLGWYMVASDYDDDVAVGKYRLSTNGESATLALKPDHSFQQEVRSGGEIRQAYGTWRRIGEGGLVFSHFVPVSGQQLSPDGTCYGELIKTLGLFPSIWLKHDDEANPSTKQPVFRKTY